MRAAASYGCCGVRLRSNLDVARSAGEADSSDACLLAGVSLSSAMIVTSASPAFAQSVLAALGSAMRRPRHLRARVGRSVRELRSRISDAMARAARELLTRSEGGLPNLAVISSVAVCWSVRHRMGHHVEPRGNWPGSGYALATVAPGIAESLAATAYGLAAAIPASIGYNRIGAATRALGRTWPRSSKSARSRCLPAPLRSRAMKLRGAARRRPERGVVTASNLLSIFRLQAELGRPMPSSLRAQSSQSFAEIPFDTAEKGLALLAQVFGELLASLGSEV
jgi:biopolymer transport protein ExbB/TolQ